MRIDLGILDKESKRPLHQQLSELLRGAIQTGVYRPGDRIEPERWFMKHGQLSQPTVSRAFRDLADEGLVLRRTGAGTFVRRFKQPEPPRLKRVGVTYYDIRTPYYERLSNGIESVARQEQIELVPTAHGDPEHESQAVLALEQERVDGMIVIPFGSRSTQRHLIRLVRTGMPIVAIHVHFPRLLCDTVDVDNELSGYLAAHHMLEQQHRRLAVLVPEALYPNTTYQEMIAGMQQACRAFGVTTDPAHIVKTPLMFNESTDPGPRETVARLFDKPYAQRPTALICASDGLAHYAYKVLGDLGWNIPTDISIIGATDLPIARRLDPPLTTVSWPMERVGRHAMRMLMDRAAHPDRAPIQRLLDVQLVVRRSVTMPPTIEEPT